MLKILTRDGWLHWVITLQLTFIAAAAGWLIAGSALADRKTRPVPPGEGRAERVWAIARETSPDVGLVQN